MQNSKNNCEKLSIFLDFQLWKKKNFAKKKFKELETLTGLNAGGERFGLNTSSKLSSKSWASLSNLLKSCKRPSFPWPFGRTPPKAPLRGCKENNSLLIRVTDLCENLYYSFTNKMVRNYTCKKPIIKKEFGVKDGHNWQKCNSCHFVKIFLMVKTLSPEQGLEPWTVRLKA